MSFLDWFRKGADGADDEPREHATPDGGSGRGHTNGFLELEEFNPDLQHPACHDVYDKMYRTDADAGQAVDLVANPISMGTWMVEPYGGSMATDEDKQIADDLEWALFEVMDPTWEGLLGEFLPVLFRSGFADGEIIWRGLPRARDGRDLLLIDGVQLRLPRSVNRFFQANGKLTGIEQFLPSWSSNSAADVSYEGGTRGAATGTGMKRIDRRNLIHWRIGAEGDNWEGVSLLRRAYKNWYIKDGVERMDAIAQEREAMGVPVLYPPPGADPDVLEQMDDAMDAMRVGETTRIRMPGMKAGFGAPDNSGWLLELIGFDRTGSGRDPQPLLDYHSNKIAAAVIADFMKLGHGSSGARATAQVQADPFLKSIEKLAGLIEREVRRQIIIPFVAANYAGARNVPSLKMSVVDQTSLTQLADFVLKLSQVGALMPDQELEDFLRKRADFPAASRSAVDDRGDKDGELRRAVVGATDAPPPSADPFGAGADARPEVARGKRQGAKPKPGQKTGAPAGPGGAGKGAPRGPARNLWIDPDDLKPYVLAADTSWWNRSADGVELNVDLDDLDETMSMSGAMLEADLGDQILAAARGEDSAIDDGTVADRIMERYGVGRMTVCSELGIDTTTLSASMDDADALSKRARIAAGHIRHAIAAARDTAQLGHGDSAHAQAAAERAGRFEARRQGLIHGVAAIQHGRHDQILDSADQVYGVRYSALLDRATCRHCEEADDGVVRSMDDPVRLDRRPPNRNCESLASGHNRCRCVEVPVPVGGGEEQSLEDHVAQLIARRGMDSDRAQAVAAAHRAHWGT